MGDDNNSWRQFMDYHSRRNDGKNNGTSEDSNNSNGDARSARSSSSEMLQLNQQQQQQQASSSNRITSANESVASAGTSNSRDRLKETRSNEDAYGRLFHGPDWERQSMDLLQPSYPTDPSGLVGRRANNPSELPCSTSSSHAHLKSPQSSAENLVGSGDCESSYYYGVFDSRCNHESLHEDVGGRCSAGPSNPCRSNQITFPHPTMKLGVDSDSDDDSLDLYLEYYKQSAKDQQQQQHKDGIHQQSSPRGQAQSAAALRSEELSAVPQQTQQPGTSRGLGILDMLEQLQALTRTRAAAAAAASRADASKSTGFSSLHNSMPFQSSVSHPGAGMYTTNENNLIVAQQYAEWEKEMDLAEDSAFSMDFYFDTGDMMDNTPTCSDMISSSRDLETLTRQDSGMNAGEVAAHQRRAASRFGLTAGLGHYQCQYSSLCPNAEASSADYNLIRVADNPRGFTPRSYFEAAAAAGGDGNAQSSSTSQTPDNVNSLEDDTTDLQKEIEMVSDDTKKSSCLDKNAEGTGDIYDLECHEISQDVLHKLTGDALVAVETEAVTSSINESPTILEVQCEPFSVNSFETKIAPLPSDGECSMTRLKQDANSDDKLLLSKISGIKSGLKNFKRRLSSCFLHPRD